VGLERDNGGGGSENGLIASLRAQVAGEVFAELVGLSKETLKDRTESAKNVSAVLIAAIGPLARVNVPVLSLASFG
jgi:hypothetical protein